MVVLVGRGHLIYTASLLIKYVNNNNLFTKEDKEPIIIKREILNSILRRNRNRVTR